MGSPPSYSTLRGCPELPAYQDALHEWLGGMALDDQRLTKAGSDLCQVARGLGIPPEHLLLVVREPWRTPRSSRIIRRRAWVEEEDPWRSKRAVDLLLECYYS